MTTTEKRVFEPNAVLIPEDGVDQRANGDVHVDPDMCTLLFLDGDRLGGRLYTAWQCAREWRRPSFELRDDHYYRLGEDQPFCRAGLGIRDQEPVPFPRIQLLPDMWVLKREETEYWDEDFRKKYRIKRIFGVYVLNKRKAVHLCEITPSYELTRFESQWDSDVTLDDPDCDEAKFQDLSEMASEAIRDEERHEEDVTYVHCSDVEGMLKEEIRVHAGDLPKGRSGGYRCDALKSVTEEDALEEIREATRNGDL